MTIFNAVYNSWRDLLDNKSDQRVKEWFMMSSPLPTISICLIYVLIVKEIAPRMMMNRKPFKLKNILIVYNFLQVVFSLKLFYDACTLAWLKDYNWRCEPLNRTPYGRHLKIAQMTYFYYLSKFTELLDTIFFILRKRNDQVSTLHVIHHAIMPFSVWWGVKFSPGGHGSFFGFLNSGVHVVMYTYYMLAAFGPQVQKYLWWKKYLTILQMAQFVLVFTHAMQLFVHNPCQYPLIFAWLCILHALMFFVLFKGYYKKTYERIETTRRVKQ